jgi:sporulation protein YlmC with PRC-barrel domain
MRLSELVGRQVVANDGTALGRVVDVRLVQDGPLLDSVRAAFRVEALIVGRRALAVRLGYGRADIQGPWLLKVLLLRLAQRAHVVPFDDVEAVDDDAIRLKTPAASVPKLGDA